MSLRWQGQGPDTEAGTPEGRRSAPGIHHERKPSLDPGVLRMYKWEGPGGRDASPGKKREAAIEAVVAVVCCSEADASGMLDYCGWDVTQSVERFLAGHPVPPPRAGRIPQPPPRLQASVSSTPCAAGAAASRLSSSPAATGSGPGRGAGGGAAGSDVGMVRLPAGTGTGSGRVQFTDGSAFTGSWVHGVVQGHGHFLCSDKEYTGDFLDGRMHGHGVHCWTTPGALLIYDGSWHMGLMHGSGMS